MKRNNPTATDKGCPDPPGQPFHSAAARWADRLRQIDYNALPISPYNKRYIHAMRPFLDYYLEIFAHCLACGLKATGLEPSGLTLVDYGGGSGFLSILAKAIGFAQVIYIDRNPLSVDTVKALKQQTGSGPDVILSGDADTLLAYCRAQELRPHLLIATDLIEHVYNPAGFLNVLCTINPRMPLIFTTASTPFNPWVKHRLHRFMNDCEWGRTTGCGYLSRREAFIRRYAPHFSPKETALWAGRTRGMIYEDIQKAIDAASLPVPADAHNTCDPETGNWAERILPIRDYRRFLSPHAYTLSVGKGFYNTRRRSLLWGLCCRLLNGLIRHGGRAGLLLSPFIVLCCRPPQAR
ncbi:MAG: class I SAM-dependent methyltransferase [Tannerellaceae bacterium]|nr:class I SAM-dependent methyltransferase [Tannerellaceae bacterium]